MNNFQVHAQRVEISKQDFSEGHGGDFRIINIICTKNDVETRVSIFVPVGYVPEITIGDRS